MKNTYPLSMALFHWILAGLMVATLVVGWLLDDYESLMALHRSLGVLVLGLGLLRLINRALASRSIPASLNEKGSLQFWAEKLVHLGLYACMLIVPVLGWLKTNAAGHVVHVFGIALPVVIQKNHQLSELFGDVHSLLADGFVVLLSLHVAGVLAHRVLHKVNALPRIMPTMKSGL